MPQTYINNSKFIYGTYYLNTMKMRADIVTPKGMQHIFTNSRICSKHDILERR